VSPTRPVPPGGEASEVHASSHLGAARPRRPVPTPLEVVVCEAIFRYQLQQPVADAPQSSHYYLALQGRDPEAAVLHRLQRLGPAVHPFSRCRVTARDGVVDRVTGVQGVILQVARLVWVHGAAVDAVGGYYCTHQHAAGFRYHVAHDRGPWAVTAAHLLWRV
jgi:hypothetical protein